MRAISQAARLCCAVIAVLGSSPGTARSAPGDAQDSGDAVRLFCSSGLALRGSTPDGSAWFSLGRAFADTREAVTRDPSQVTKLLSALGYSALNLADPDLDVGAQGLRSVCGSSPVPILSANIRVSETRELVAKPYCILNIGGKRLGVTGVTARPSRELRDWIVDDPVEGLKDILPRLEKESDGILLLAWTDRDEAARLLRTYRSIRWCITGSSGVSDPVPLSLESSVLVQGPTEKHVWSRTDVRLAKAEFVQLSYETAPREVPESLKPQLESCGLLEDGGRGLLVRGEPKGIGPADPPTPEHLGLEKVEWLAASRSNRSAKLVVHSIALRAAYGAFKAAAKSAFLVVDTEWENIIPLTFIYERQVPTIYKIPNLADHLYLVVNGTRIARLRSDADSLPGHLPVVGFSLERIGSKRRGNLVFEVPAEGLETLEIRFYDYAHGHMTFPLLALPKGAKATEPKLVGETRENEIMTAGVYDLSKTAEFGGRKAPPGMTFVSFDLLAVSRFQYPADATAFDPKAKKGDEIKIGCVCDWEDARNRVFAVVDGEYGYELFEGTSLPAKPRFLPEVRTGVRLAYLVPEQYVSLEIRCEYPNARMPQGGIVHPVPLVLPVEGKRPELQKHESIVGTDDDIFRVDVVGQTVAGEVAGRKARAGQKFLILDVTVGNRGKKSEVFQCPAQLKYITERGAQLAWHESTKALSHGAAAKVSIPSSERRSFQIAFELPETEKKYRLAYLGVSKAETLVLRPESEEKPKKRVCNSCGREAPPADKFCEGCGKKLGD